MFHGKGEGFKSFIWFRTIESYSPPAEIRRGKRKEFSSKYVTVTIKIQEDLSVLCILKHFFSHKIKHHFLTPYS